MTTPVKSHVSAALLRLAEKDIREALEKFLELPTGMRFRELEKDLEYFQENWLLRDMQSKGQR